MKPGLAGTGGSRATAQSAPRVPVAAQGQKRPNNIISAKIAKEVVGPGLLGAGDASSGDLAPPHFPPAGVSGIRNQDNQ